MVRLPEDYPAGSRDLSAAREMVSDGIAALMIEAKKVGATTRGRTSSSDVCSRAFGDQHDWTGAGPVPATRPEK